MCDLIVSVPDHCLSFYFMQIFVTHPHFEEVIIYDDAKPIFGETKFYPG